MRWFVEFRNINMDIKRVICYLLFVFFFFSCRKGKDYLEDALRLAGNNRVEMEKVLLHYRQTAADSLKYHAAVYLIENMPGHISIDYPDMDDYYRQIREVFATKDNNHLVKQVKINRQKLKPVYDIQTISASYLIDHIDHTFETRHYPWTQSVSWEDFCEYVLPYRVAQEPLEDWRPVYRSRMMLLLDSLATVQASDSLVCVTLMSSFKPQGFVWTSDGFPLFFKPSLYLEMNIGTCTDLTLLAHYVFRMAGLPILFDFTPQWGNRSLGHDWNAIVINGTTATFQMDDNVPFGEHLPSKSHDKLAKVYRRMFSLQKESLPMQFPKEDIPPLFRNPLIRDVSEYYFNPLDIQVNLIYPPPGRKKIAYLMVFDNKNWSPVAWGRIISNQVTFSKMNTDCVYLAMYYDNGQYYAASQPFYVDNEGKTKILNPYPEDVESAKILRKYRYRHDTNILNKLMPGGKFQVANRPDFKDAVTIHEIDTLQHITYQYVVIDDLPAYKYFRYLSSDSGHVSMAEILVYDAENRKLTGKIIGTDGSITEYGFDKTSVFDGDHLTFFETVAPSGGWVGLAFEEKECIKTIKYLPRNDDNFINENEAYELFYFDRKWISLGRRTGDSTHELNYENVPRNALLLLRNYTKGEQERVFTYEEGKQVFH